MWGKSSELFLRSHMIPGRPKNQSVYNAFMAANLPGAIDSSGDAPTVNYAKLVLAQGGLPRVEVSGATVDAAGVTVNYATNNFFPKANATDVVMAVVKTINGAVVLGTQPRGSEVDGSVLIPYPNVNAADILYVCVFVTSADGQRASNSQYVALV